MKYSFIIQIYNEDMFYQIQQISFQFLRYILLRKTQMKHLSKPWQCITDFVIIILLSTGNNWKNIYAFLGPPENFRYYKNLAMLALKPYVGESKK